MNDKQIDKLLNTTAILALCFLFYLAGIFFTELNMTRKTVSAMKGLYAHSFQLYSQYLRPNTLAANNVYWMPRRYSQEGVLMHQPEAFFGEYTLYTSAESQSAKLIDRQGKEVHRWSLDFTALLNEEEKRSSTPISESIHWRDVYLYPNGDLLVLLVINGRTPWGLAIMKIDKDSRLLWHKKDYYHHDLHIANDGRIFALKSTLTATVPPDRRFIETPLMEEYVSVLDVEGNLQKEISIYDAIINSNYQHLARRLKWSAAGDYLHPNALEYIDEEKAQYADYLKPDTVLINLRDIESVVAINLITEKLEWAMTGPWYRQHDPDLLPNGNIMMFDNRSLGEQSRVIEYDPRSRTVEWEYRGTDELPLYSKIRARQHPLANGNVLITESNGGRLLEVDRQGKLVWEFYNTISGSDQGSEKEYTPGIMGGYRYQTSELPFIKEQDQ